MLSPQVETMHVRWTSVLIVIWQIAVSFFLFSLSTSSVSYSAGGELATSVCLHPVCRSRTQMHCPNQRRWCHRRGVCAERDEIEPRCNSAERGAIEPRGNSGERGAIEPRDNNGVR